ncbi:hypothetical protein [Pseudoalteromonas sp. G4]|uniref:hypothetical protein n=1 Tax=Pseudoalteromonas sp. G4 TaxID=2992761 RepID=UPI00237D9E88|nr:hypothetical protein [Pseudoalteromonas sp. G4]MDE3271238.1 hypothetical protein [Pseudoalteromonas sp. G4]
MKLFNKALVASAVLGAFSAHAVDVSSAKIKLSEEGVAAGNSGAVGNATNNLVLDFVVGALTPASSFIELEFSEGVDWSNVTIQESSIDNDVTNGEGNVNLADGNMTFDYGTGSFTFDNVALDTSEKKDVLSFKVNLGNPLVANSAFRLTVADLTAGTNDIEITGSEEVCYTSFQNNSGEKGDVIETGCVAISELESQYSFTVSTEWDGIIERVEQITFVKDGDTDNANNDTLTYKISSNESLPAAIEDADAEIKFAGNFEDLDGTNFTVNHNAGGATPTATVNGDEDAVNFTLADGDFAVDGTVESGTVTFSSSNATVIPVTGEIVATATFTDGTDNFKVITDDAGQWALDAVVINVPYFPVNFSGVVSQVHIANEANTTADVIVSAIDDQGVEYGPLDLGSDLAANTVNRVKAADLAALFSITDSRKLSVTFNIDADADDVAANATVQSSTGRSEVSNSQYKVDGK